MRRIAFYSPVFFALVVLLTAQTIEHEPEREHWQQPAAIFEAMAVAPGSIVADVGAGDGFLTLRLAPLVGANGHVYAEDIAQSRLDLLRVRAQEAHLDNITVITGSPDDPHLPAAQLDAVVILNAYHEMPQHNEMLRRIHGALKPGGRLVIAEPSPAPGEGTREQQTAKHHIASTFIAEDMDRAGFTVIETREKFAHIPDAGYYSLVVGRRPE